MKMRIRVLDRHDTTGTSDYLVKIVVAYIAACHHCLHDMPFRPGEVAQVSTSVPLYRVKGNTVPPF